MNEPWWKVNAQNIGDQPEPKNQESWEREFIKLAYPIVHSNSFPEKDSEYLEELVDFIRNLFSQTKKDLKDKVLRILEDVKKEMGDIPFDVMLNQTDSYNKCLADIKSKIEKEL